MSPWMITFVEESIPMLRFNLSTGIESTCIPFSIVVSTRQKDDDVSIDGAFPRNILLVGH